VALLRKSIPQSRNLKAAAELNVMRVQKQKLKRFGKYAKAKTKILKG
jgi:hypothetical protein